MTEVAVNAPEKDVSLFLSSKKDGQLMMKVMEKFEQCHELAQGQVNQEYIVGKQTREQIDQCAVDFRLLCEQTSLIAHKHASCWCKKAVRYFKNLDRLRHSTRIISKLRDDAETIAKLYIAISKYCQRLCAEIKAVGSQTIKESDGFSARFLDAHKFAHNYLEEKETILKEAAEGHERIESKVKKTAWFFFVPVIGQVYGVAAGFAWFSSKAALSIANGVAEVARRDEERTLDDLTEAEKLQHGVRGVTDFLDGISQMSQAMAGFWMTQHKEFNARAEQIGELGEAVEADDGEDEFIAEELVEEFERIQKALLQYSHVATLACTSYNFVTDRQPRMLPEISDEEFQAILSLEPDA